MKKDKTLEIKSVAIRFSVNGTPIYQSTALQAHWAARYAGTGKDEWIDVLNSNEFMFRPQPGDKLQLEFMPIVEYRVISVKTTWKEKWNAFADWWERK